MEVRDVARLMIYGASLWPRTFVVPTVPGDLAVAKQVWMDVLGDLDTEVIRAAMVSWTDHWPPTPHELRAAALDQRNREAGISAAPSPDQAWLEFKTGYRLDDDWSHPAVAATARSLGCKAYGNSPEADEMAWRAHFMKLYDSAVRSHRSETSPLPPILERRSNPALEQMRAELGTGDA